MIQYFSGEQRAQEIQGRGIRLMASRGLLLENAPETAKQEFCLFPDSRTLERKIYTSFLLQKAAKTGEFASLQDSGSLQNRNFASFQLPEAGQIEIFSLESCLEESKS